MDKITHLKTNYLDSIKREKKVLDVLLPQNKKFLYTFQSLVKVNETFALHSLFINNDSTKTKNYFYKISKLGEYIYNVYEQEPIEFNLKHLSYSLLSDHPTLINYYLELIDKTKEVPEFIIYHIHKAIRCVINNDKEGIQQHIDGINETHMLIEDFVCHQEFSQVFVGFLHEDKQEIEKGVQALVNTHKEREHHPLLTNFFSVETTALAKLAWKLGFEVEVESPLIPKELLPIQELSLYEGYDFFEEVNKVRGPGFGKA